MSGTINSVILYIHIVCGAMLFMFAGIMQLVVGPVMSKIKSAQDKQEAMAVIRKRAEPVMKSAILIMSISALYLIHSRWALIQASWVMSIKVLLGGSALIFANTLHFYLRKRKMKLQKSNSPQDERTLKKIQTLSQVMEKTVLIGAVSAYLLGVAYNHL